MTRIVEFCQNTEIVGASTIKNYDCQVLPMGRDFQDKLCKWQELSSTVNRRASELGIYRLRSARDQSVP